MPRIPFSITLILVWLPLDSLTPDSFSIRLWLPGVLQFFVLESSFASAPPPFPAPADPAEGLPPAGAFPPDWLPPPAGADTPAVPDDAPPDAADDVPPLEDANPLPEPEPPPLAGTVLLSSAAISIESSASAFSTMEAILSAPAWRPLQSDIERLSAVCITNV